MTRGVTLAELNACTQPRFVEALGWIFEDSPWVAERAWPSRPFASVDDLHRAMTEAMEQGTLDERLALLRAHPDLGTRARMSDASIGEQQGAGLDRLTAEEFDRLQRLNREYREKFGFPFLFAVKGSTRHDVLTALQQRLPVAPEREFEEALRQVGRIALFRLQEMLG
jgi:2-oxo-4-hydroxy-4-carboxy-5-ureidoimidazoline decarboxylase